ncbi:MAG TPA: S-methyl-5-thioribose kinase [Spirochaetia bacterium]|nr:S-methyl-5-thioribose kinase [Spirochaetia bacterium]
MRDFDHYFIMKSADAAEFARTRFHLFEPGAVLEHAEIGDGNLNYIFRIREPATGKAAVIKQAGPTARLSDQFKVSPDRNRIEHDILVIENDLAPGLVPKVFGYDPVMNALAMEDLSDHTIMRSALLERRTFPLFADHITTFMVNTLLLTSDVVMDHKKKKETVKGFINPDLCEITEDLVYTEPFNDVKKRNDPFPPNLDFIRRELYEDKEILLETAKMKFDFFCNAQCLVHGDLHTGSIFVREDSTKAIDPEFAYYGPAGYDVGNVIANLIFAWANADTVMEQGSARSKFTGWIEKTIDEVMGMFVSKWKALWARSVTEPTARYDGFAEWYLDGILRDTAGVAGLELCRRIVGIAHVKDITSIKDEAQRLRAERLCITAAKRYIRERDRITTGSDYLDVLFKAAKKYARGHA